MAGWTACGLVLACRAEVLAPEKPGFNYGRQLCQVDPGQHLEFQGWRRARSGVVVILSLAATLRIAVGDTFYPVSGQGTHCPSDYLKGRADHRFQRRGSPAQSVGLPDQRQAPTGGLIARLRQRYGPPFFSPSALSDTAHQAPRVTAAFLR